MRIVVTGAAGFVGSHLAERLAGLGHEVTGIDSLTGYYSRELKELNAADVEAKGVEVLRLDLAADSAAGELRRAAAGAEVIYHLAAQPGISASVPFDEYVRNNVTTTHRLVEAALGAEGLRSFVYISTSSVYGAYATEPETAAPRPTSYYGVTKLAAEQLALSYHRRRRLPVCSLRLFSVYGPRERPEKLYTRLIGSILNNTEFPLCEGSREHRRSYTFIGDVLDGFAAVLDHLGECNGEIFNIGSDVEHTTGEGIEIIEGILGRRARMRSAPPRAGDQLRTHADIAKARRVLAYSPSRTLAEGLREQVEWYKAKVHGRISLWPDG
jgi:nucleoside-diphosphate-sugar epimerase